MDWNYLFTSFDGRISRQPFWIGSLVLSVASLVVSFVVAAIFGQGVFGSLLQFIVALAILYPSVAIAAKRFHDRDKSGWWILIVLIPFIGLIWYIVELGFLPGTPGPNRFGPDPLGGSSVRVGA
jgi:uncharacterized membrane protein YhaH (DUF805 family)